jgi:arylformamidase
MDIQYLSYLLDENTPAYGGEENLVKLEQIRSISKGDTSNNTVFNFPGHIGTHIDFPFHFSNEGKKMKDYAADFWVFNKVGFLSCAVHEIALGTEALPVDIELLIVKTGFGEKRGQAEYWQSQPVVRHDLADLLRQRFPHLRVFGFDLISLTSKLDRLEGKIAHQRFLLGNEILVLEDMFLSSLYKTPAKVIIAPLQIGSADGVPCTVIAM